MDRMTAEMVQRRIKLDCVTQEVQEVTYLFTKSILAKQIIKIFHGCEVRIEKSVRGSLFGITRLCRVMPNSDPEGPIFLSAPNNHDRFFFLRTFWSPAFDFSVGVAINKSHSYTLMSAILKVAVICDVAVTSTHSVLTTELGDLLYSKCIDNMCCYSIFICPTGRIRLCKLRFISTG